MMWQRARIILGPLTGAELWVEAGKARRDRPVRDGVLAAKAVAVRTVAVGQPPPLYVMPEAQLELLDEYRDYPEYLSVEQLQEQAASYSQNDGDNRELIELMGKHWFIEHQPYFDRRAAEHAAELARAETQLKPAVVEIAGLWRVLLPAQ